MALLPSSFSDCVVAIGVEQEKGETFWNASGFFYGERVHKATTPEDKDRYNIYLVSNKHVFATEKKIKIRVNPKALAQPKEYTADLVNPKSGKQIWVGHYREKVDVAVVQINFSILQKDNMQVDFFRDAQQVFDVKAMIENGLTEGDNAFVLGFPVSILDDKSSSVIVRDGCLARVRDTLKSPQEPFLVDTVVFPGNSGGPVINKPEIASIEGTPAVLTANLIGIVASYLPYRDIAISKQTGNPRVIFEENSGLSKVYSVDCIKSAINSYKRKKKVLDKALVERARPQNT